MIHNFFLQPHSFHCTSTAVLGSPHTHTTRAPCQALIPLPNASFIGRQGEFRNISFRCTSTAVLGSPRTHTTRAPCQALIPLPNASFIGRQGEFRNISFRCTSTAVFGSPRTCTSFACTTSRGSHRLRGLITREKQTSCRLTCLPGAGKRVDPSVHAESLRRGKRQSKVRQRKRWKSP